MPTPTQPQRSAARSGRGRGEDGSPRCAPQVSPRPPPPLRAAPRPLRLCLGGRPARRGVTWSLPPPPASPEPALRLVPAPCCLRSRRGRRSRRAFPGRCPTARRAEFNRAGNCHVKHSRPRAPGAGLPPGPRSRGARARTPAARGPRGGAFGGGPSGRGRLPSPGGSLAARPAFIFSPFWAGLFVSLQRVKDFNAVAKSEQHFHGGAGRKEGTRTECSFILHSDCRFIHSLHVTGAAMTLQGLHCRYGKARDSGP